MGGWTEQGPLHGFLEAAPDAIVVVDEGGTIAAVNRLTEAMFGYPRRELLGQPVEMLVPDTVRQAHAAHRTAYARNPRTRSMGEGRELSGRRRDGSEFPIEISLSPLETDDGRVVISIIRDTTQRRLADARFRNLLESAPDGIVVVDPSGRIDVVNGQTEAMFGYTRDELVGQLVEILVPERFRGGHVGRRVGYFALPRTRAMGAGQALTGRRKDGSEFPVEISLSLLDTERGTRVTSIIRDMTDRREAEEKIHASLREKEVLLKEIHHRVKNNFQVTSSLLKLQSAHLADEAARAMFTAAQGRIRSMALVHEKLYQAGDLSRIDFTDYVRSLARLLYGSLGVDASRIELEVQGDTVFLPVDTAVPCGLLTNELVSNCIKHAFPDQRSGRIHIVVTREEGNLAIVEVSDDGVGIAPGRAAQSDTLGLELVRTLARQLDAALDIGDRTGGGTSERLRVPDARR
jgi:PAS domain S-box-containing protein